MRVMSDERRTDSQPLKVWVTERLGDPHRVGGRLHAPNDE